jgi:PAS domain S-box-containing protein
MIARQQTFLKQFIEESVDAKILFSKSKAIVLVNKAAQELFGESIWDDLTKKTIFLKLNEFNMPFG